MKTSMNFAAVVAFTVAASIASSFAMADESAAKAVRTTSDMTIEAGVDRTHATESFRKAHENDVIGMAGASDVNQQGQGYPTLRK